MFQRRPGVARRSGCPALALCLLGARPLDEPASAVLLALASGALWGVFAVLTKGVVDRLDDGLWAALSTPELYVWALVAVAGTAWQQASFRAGAQTASLPTMTVTEPVVASALGIFVVGEALRPGDDGWLTADRRRGRHGGSHRSVGAGRGDQRRSGRLVALAWVSC